MTQKLPEEQVGRYAIFDPIAAGGMARVHLARLAGQQGFSRVVAVKRMHQHLLENAEFKAMFLDEARLAARVRHPNVVPILDVIATGDELLLVMEYVHGVSIHALMLASVRARAHMPRPIVYALLANTLHGLHAAHEARDERGELLGLVHRDVSPQNVLVGVDGVARVVDFGVARAVRAKHDTDPGVLKGKHSYMAPELIEGGQATRRSDVFSATTLFWELLTGRKLFGGASEQERLRAILASQYPSPCEHMPDLPATIERIVLRGIARDPNQRYQSALEMAIDLETYAAPASARLVGEWVAGLAADELGRREHLIHQIETSSPNIARTSLPPVVATPAAAREAVAGGLERAEPRSRLRRVLFAAAALVALGSVATLAAGRADPAPPAAALPVTEKRSPAPLAEPPPGVSGIAAVAAPASEPALPESTAADAAAAQPEIAVPERSARTTNEPRWRAPQKPKEFLPDEL